MEQRWAEVDSYLAERLLPAGSGLEEALRASAAAGLPPDDVSPLQGRLLELLARLRGARAILELGTLGGYSTIWLARALPPEGRLVTLEADPHHAEVARANVARAGLSERCGSEPRGARILPWGRPANPWAGRSATYPAAVAHTAQRPRTVISAASVTAPALRARSSAGRRSTSASRSATVPQEVQTRWW